jgi:hypothetical protein
MGTDRAARQILSAVRQKKPQLTLTLIARSANHSSGNLSQFDGQDRQIGGPIASATTSLRAE